jgi:hypothetical protein
MSGAQQEWPNRGVEILVSTVILCILSTLILIWRVIYGVKTKRKMLVCDYLLIVAAVSRSNALAIVQAVLTLVVDLERHDDHHPFQGHPPRTGETYQGSQHYIPWRYHTVQLFHLPESGHQPDRSGYLEVLYLRLSVVSQVFHRIHHHRMGIYRHGHRFQLDRTSAGKFRLHALRGKLEFGR